MGLGLVRKPFHVGIFALTAIAALSMSACSPIAPVITGSLGSNSSQSTEAAYCTLRANFSGGLAVSGYAKFEYRALNLSSGLSGDPVQGVIPAAEIQVSNSAGTVIQCAETDATGAISLNLPMGADTYTLKVFSRSANAQLNASVLEDYYTNQPYAISTTFSTTAVQSFASLGTVLAPARQTDSVKIEGGAFNILFQLWRANQFLRDTVSGFTSAPKVSVYWKAGYNPYRYFGGTSPLSFYRPGYKQLFILGGDLGVVKNVDTDHFDNSVIIHEYGHFLEDVYGKTNSPGGSHNGNAIIDPRLAWSEGWGNFFQAAVQNHFDGTYHYYVDTQGFSGDSVETTASGSILIKVDLSVAGSGATFDPVGTAGEGTFREMSITRFLYKALVTVSLPFQNVWNIFSGVDSGSTPVGFASSQVAFRNIASFNQLLVSSGAITSPMMTSWNALLVDEKQNTTPHDYASALSLQTAGSCSTVSLSPVVDSSSQSNLLRSNDFYRFDYDGNPSTTIQLSYSGGNSDMDLDLFVYREDYVYQQSSASENGTIVTRSAQPFAIENGSEQVSFAGLPAGRYLINVKAYTEGKLSAQLSGQTAIYRLQITHSAVTEDLCPAF